MSSKLPWYTVNEIGPWNYDGPIETFKQGWPYSRIYSSFDRIDRRFNHAGMIWRPARSETPTMASDPTVIEAIHRVTLQDNAELFDAVPENPIEV